MNLPEREHAQLSNKKRTSTPVNIMVAGGPFSGKTTLVRSLWKWLGYVPSEAPASSLAQTIDDSVELDLELDDDGKTQRISLRIMDSPSIRGKQELNDILSYVFHQFEDTMHERSKIRRNVKWSDKHIHVMLYCLDPSSRHKITDHDRMALRALSPWINLIPVIPKSDLLSLTDLRLIKRSLRKQLFSMDNMHIHGSHDLDPDPNPYEKLIEYYKNSQDEDEESAHIAEVYIRYLEHVPFAVFGSEAEFLGPEEIPSVSGQTMIGRRYMWGDLECMNPSHGELCALMSMLSHSLREFLREDTFEIYYERYRTEKIRRERALERAKSEHYARSSSSTSSKAKV